MHEKKEGVEQGTYGSPVLVGSLGHDYRKDWRTRSGLLDLLEIWFYRILWLGSLGSRWKSWT